jgi:hypothetical protein
MKERSERRSVAGERRAVIGEIYADRPPMRGVPVNPIS